MNYWMVCLAFVSAPSSRLTESMIPEILDFGYPQNSESDTLKMYITTEGVKSEQAVVSFVPATR